MSGSSSGQDAGPIFRCGTLARWIPRALAAAAIVAAALVTQRLVPSLAEVGAGWVRTLFWVTAAFVGFWILRTGRELQLVVELEDGGLTFINGSRRSGLRISAVVGLRFESPFSTGRRWIAAAVLVDDDGNGWRIPVALEHGDRLIRAVLDQTDEPSIRTWAEVLGIENRMRRRPLHIALSYLTALLTITAATVFYLH